MNLPECMHLMYCKAIFDKELDSKLTSQERRDFLELAYPVIIDHLLKHFDATTMNITCKDGIDRGGKTQGLFIQYLAIGEENGFTADRKKMMAAIALARAPLVKAQPMIGSRRRRFLSALQRTEAKGCYDRLRTQFWNHEHPIITPPTEKPSQQAIAA